MKGNERLQDLPMRNLLQRLLTLTKTGPRGVPNKPTSKLVSWREILRRGCTKGLEESLLEKLQSAVDVVMPQDTSVHSNNGKKWHAASVDQRMTS